MPHVRNSGMNKHKDSAGKTRQAYVPYAVSQKPQERFHTLQLWSREGACRGIAYPCILEFEFNASGTILLHLPPGSPLPSKEPGW
jgi:hypothetical protein